MSEKPKQGVAFPRFRFGIRTMMIATAVVASLIFVFIAEYEFTTIESTATSHSPDGKYSIVVESKFHKSLFRNYRTIESSLSGPSPGMLGAFYHHIGPPLTRSTIPADYAALGKTAIAWDITANTCKYPITDQEEAIIGLAGSSIAGLIVVPIETKQH